MQDEQAPEPEEETPEEAPVEPIPQPAEVAQDAREATDAEALAVVQAEDPRLATKMVERYGGYDSELCRQRNPALYAKIRRP